MKMWPARTLKPLLWKIKGAYCLSTVSLNPPPTSTLAYRCNASCAGKRKSWTKPTGFDTGLTTYNSLTKQKEPLILAQEGIATWYSCGPTVYDHAHLGHACSYVRFDILQRILSKVFGITVIHAMVITDIDDKIIRRSLEENISPTVLARIYEEDFKNDMLALKVIPPAVYLRVTENVPQIVAYIEQIIQNGHAYSTKQGDVYFDIQSIRERYGKLTGSGDATTEPGESEKRDARDFALWKSSKPQEPFWTSPWGNGRPGWHIECSTVASSVFGNQLDIHSGGIDLAFPHHENEIAQCEAYHQCDQWGNYFLHSGHLHLKGSTEKMSKSLKNYITIKDFLQFYSANEFRMFCLLTKYRSAIDYSDASMIEARSSLATIDTFTHDAQAYMRGHLQCQAVQEGSLFERLEETKASVRKALADDFDTPRAIGAIMNLVYHGNRHLQPITKPDGSPRSPAVFGAMLSYIREAFEVLGVDLLDRKESQIEDSSGTLQNVVEQLARFRSEVRAFALAPVESAPGEPVPARPKPRPDRLPLLQACDVLRKDLAPLGVLIKDRGTNSTWEISQTRSADQDK
ncbi:cysteine--tRNA ligase, mitochondrial isoform X2 [Hypomesus transpacificus]|uniref:cysteine--tRNA ligase, mitochondrial isoform X2 n=1 Tax=Hypomesus transpacificus TaxID=137520 RepID=UPI001F076CED|nr:cysteine--tRNA ligase, mitochondrial isoform X2 [Hypomesus transpacificus]